MTLDLRAICASGRTHLMGILNVTPDSFYDGSDHLDPAAAIKHAHALVAAGADLLDIGCESSRPPQIYNPSSPPQIFQVDEEEELQRLSPVLEELFPSFPIPISIDTMKASVARYACEKGAAMINDVSGFRDPTMREVAAESGAVICVMHMQGTPATMQVNPDYPEGVVPTLLRFFEERVALLLKEGVREEKICLDPGIGFGKTVAHNLTILQNLQKFRNLGFPLLIGASRKMFLSRLTGKPTAELLPATLGLSALLIEEGVELLRVHDVDAHRDLCEVVGAMRTASSSCTRVPEEERV